MRGFGQPPDPRLRGRGREPQRRRRARARRARVPRRPLGLRLRHRPRRRRRRRARRRPPSRRRGSATRTSTTGCPTSAPPPTSASSPRPSWRDWSTERKVELAIEVERAARAHDGVSQVEDTVYADADARAAIANSRGFAAELRGHPGVGLRVGVRRRGRRPDDRARRRPRRGPRRSSTRGAIGDEAAERALALVGARQPRRRRCPVVLDAFVAASFVGFIGGMLSADAVQRGRSLFAGREGERVADPALRLVRRRDRPRRAGERPVRRRGLADAPHAADRGAERCRRSSSTRARARKGGRATTGERDPVVVPQPAVASGTTNLVVGRG